MSKFDLEEGFKLMRSIHPPSSLRENILNAISTNTTTELIHQLRLATIMSVCLFILIFSGYLLSSQPNEMMIFDISPNNNLESLLLATNGISSDAVLETIIQTY